MGQLLDHWSEFRRCLTALLGLNACQAGSRSPPSSVVCLPDQTLRLRVVCVGCRASLLQAES